LPWINLLALAQTRLACIDNVVEKEMAFVKCFLGSRELDRAASVLCDELG
jgi:hypothetical protein